MPGSVVFRGRALAHTLDEKMVERRITLHRDIGTPRESRLPYPEVFHRHLVIAFALENQQRPRDLRRLPGRVVTAQVEPVMRLLQLFFRGLLSVYSCYGLHARGVAKRPFPSKAPTASLPPLPFRLLLGGANQFPGGSCTR